MIPDAPKHLNDGTPLPDDWHMKLPVRWVLDPNKLHQCDACLSFAGEYPNWQTMLEKTQGASPGFFPACSRPDEMTSAKQLVACWDACRCTTGVEVNGKWKRVG